MEDRILVLKGERERRVNLYRSLGEIIRPIFITVKRVQGLSCETFSVCAGAVGGNGPILMKRLRVKMFCIVTL